MTRKLGPVITDPEVLRKYKEAAADTSAHAVGADPEPPIPSSNLGPVVTDPEVIAQYKAQTTEAKPDTRSTLAKVDDTVARHLQNFYYGAGSSVAKGIISYGGFDQAIGGSAGADIANFGVKMDDWLKAKTGQLRDDHTMADQFSTAFGNMASFLIPGWGTQAIATKAAVNFPKYANIIGQLFGSGTAAVMEAAMEHGDRVQEEMANGATPAEAAIKAKEVFWYNIPVILATNQGYFTPMGKLARVLMNAPAEGIQETVQQIISNLDADRPWQEGIRDAFIVGAGVGGAVSALTPSEGVAPTVEQISQDRATQDLTSAVGPAPQQAPPVKSPVKPPEIEVAPGFEEVGREKPVAEQTPAAQQTETPIEKAVAEKTSKSEFSPLVQEAVETDARTRSALENLRKPFMPISDRARLLKKAKGIKETVRQIRDIIDDDKRSWKRIHRKFYEHAWDDITYLYSEHREALERANENWFEHEANKPSQTPHTLAQLSRASSTVATNMWKEGVLDWETHERTTRGMEEILENVDDIQYWEKLWQVMSIEEYAEQRPGLVDNIALKRAQQIRADILKVKPGWEAIVDEVGAFENAFVKWLEQAGVVEKSLFQTVVRMYKRHMPMYKAAMLDENGRISDESLREAKERFGPNAGVRAGSFLGRKGKIEKGTVYVNPLEAMIGNMLYLTDAAMINDSKAALGREGDRLKDPAFVKRVLPDTKSADLTRAELGKIIDVSEMSDEEIKAITTIHSVAKTQTEGILAYREKGETRYLAVSPDVWRMYKTLNRDSVHAILKWLSLSTKFLRATVTMTPDFASKNWSKDLMTASTLGHFISPKNVGWAIWQILPKTKGKGWSDFLADAAGQGTMSGADMNLNEKRLKEIKKKGKPYVILRHPLASLQALSNKIDSLSRMPQHKIQMQKNMKKVAAGEMTMRDARVSAAAAARWPSIDFLRSGSSVKKLNLLYEFFTAAMQGIDIAVRKLGQPGMPGKGLRWAKALSTYTVGSIILWAINHDEDWYIDSPRWLKNGAWLVSFDDGEVIYVIPKPFELGIFFGSLPERILDWKFNQDPEAVNSWLRDFSQVVAPIDVPPSSGWVPTPLGTGLIEWVTNQVGFTGRDIVPYYLGKIDPKYQYDERTSEVAKLFGEFGPFDASPKKVDQFISTTAGSVSKIVRPMLDEIIYVAMPERKRARPSKHRLYGIFPMDWALFRSFTRPGAQRSTRWTNDFYKIFKKTEESALALDHLINRGAPDATVRKQIREDIMWIRSYRYFNQYRYALGEINKRMRVIEETPLMTPDEKRDAMDRDKKMRNDMAKAAVEYFTVWANGVTDEDIDKIAEDAWKRVKPALEKKRGKGKITGGQ